MAEGTTIGQLPDLPSGAGTTDYIALERSGATYKGLLRSLLEAIFVKKTGDTMTGDLTIDKSVPGVILKNANTTDGTAPSQNTNSMGFRVRDKNGNNIAQFTDYWTPDGRQGAWVAGFNKGVANGLLLFVDANGNRSVSVSDAAAWRAGIGLGDVSTISTVSSIVSAGTNCTVSSAIFKQWGKMAQLIMTIRNSAAITASGSSPYVIGTLVSGKRPSLATNAFDISMNYYLIEESGQIKVYKNYAANTVFNVRVSFLLP